MRNAADGRLLVAGPNLTVDRTAALPTLRPGEVLRTGDVAVTPGGKGVNVVRAAQRLGAQAALVALVPGRLGQAVALLLADEGVALTPVPTTGEVRSTLILFEDGGRVTVLNEPGPRVEPDRWRAYEDAVGSGLVGAGLLVCSGSSPPGTPPDGFGRLVARGRAAGVPVLVDTSAVLLGGALDAGPDVVTPNLAEAEAVLDGESAAEPVDVDPRAARGRALDAATRLRARGAGAAVVTAGAAGAAVAAGGAPWWVPAPRVTVANPIGAGDTFAAGLAVALARGADLHDATLSATAAAAAGVAHPLAGGLDPALAASLRRDLDPEVGGAPQTGS